MASVSAATDPLATEPVGAIEGGASAMAGWSADAATACVSRMRFGSISAAMANPPMRNAMLTMKPAPMASMNDWLTAAVTVEASSDESWAAVIVATPTLSWAASITSARRLPRQSVRDVRAVEAVDDGADQRDAERTAQLARDIVDGGADTGVVHGDRGHHRVGERRLGEPGTDAEEEQCRRNLQRRGVRVELRQRQHPEDHRAERAQYQDPRPGALDQHAPEIVAATMIARATGTIRSPASNALRP